MARGGGNTPGFRSRLAARPQGRTAVGALSVAAFLIVWQIIGSTSKEAGDLVSFPSEILRQFIAILNSGELADNLRVTLGELAIGFVPAVIVGVALGAGFALSRRFRHLLEPIFVTMYVSPYIAFVPVLTVWFGVGGVTKSIIVFVAAVVPITINTTTGVTEIPEQWIRPLRAFGASRSQIIAKAILPGALPSVMTGIRLAVGRAIVAVVAAEMYVSTKGIGSLIQVYSLSGRTSLILVFVGLVSIFGLICVALLRSIEGRLAPWRSGA